MKLSQFMAMNYRLFLAIILVNTAVLFTSCGKGKDRVTSPPPESVTSVITTGENVFRSLITDLSQTLQHAMTEEGVAGAIDVCNIKALPLTEKITDANERVTQIKRTSYHYRNRKNRPDKYEKSALDYFQKFIDTNKPLPSYYVQKIENQSTSFFRYYKPLTVMPLCLNCHGRIEDMNPDVVAEINKKYPKDTAAGYSLNDFRGVVSISISDNPRGN